MAGIVYKWIEKNFVTDPVFELLYRVEGRTWGPEKNWWAAFYRNRQGDLINGTAFKTESIHRALL